MSDATTAIPTTGRQIRSLVTADGDVELSLMVSPRSGAGG